MSNSEQNITPHSKLYTVEEAREYDRNKNNGATQSSPTIWVDVKTKTRVIISS